MLVLACPRTLSFVPTSVFKCILISRFCRSPSSLNGPFISSKSSDALSSFLDFCTGFKHRVVYDCVTVSLVPYTLYQLANHSRRAKHSAFFSMISLRALYLNFKNDFGDLLEVTDFSIATWLAFGAGLQLLSQSWLPPSLSYWVPLLYLFYRIIRVSVDCRRIFTGTFTNVVFGRWSATLPEPEDPSAVTATSDGIVMFLLGARINQLVSDLRREGMFGCKRISLICRSPLGKLAPGNAEIDTVFKNMWTEAEKNRTKWSCESSYRSLYRLLASLGLFLSI